MSKRDDPQLRIRIPQQLKDELEKIAAANDRTLTAEITRRLRESLGRETENVPVETLVKNEVIRFPQTEVFE